MTLREDTSRGTVVTGSGMNKELFGVFGDQESFTQYRDPREFDVLLTGTEVTVGVRDPALGIPGRSCVAESEEGFCTVWGEAFAPSAGGRDSADWLLSRFANVGGTAFEELNGSYLAIVEHEGEAVVACDPIRSWECFYADVSGDRVFGTDSDAVTRLVEEPTPKRRSLLEFLHLGTVLGTATLHEEVERVPFDGYLTAEGTGEFRRFVYDPQSFDYVDELAERLRRAINRRADYPGEKGILLSGGQDSRSILSVVPDIDECYTIGSADSQEVKVAKRLAQQYDSNHTVLPPDGRYLCASSEKIRYTQGIRESIHIHHACYNDELEVDTMYHGLLYDTLFKGPFLEHDGMELFGTKLPSKRLAADPDPVGFLLDTLGFMPEGSPKIAAATGELFDGLELADPEAFIRERLRTELQTCRERVDSVHNATNLLVLRNQPVMDFRVHFADNYLESFIGSDLELLRWHLETPPQHRHTETMAKVLDRIDDDLLKHRPPTQPHDVELLNHLERFARRKIPLLRPFEPAWPDRHEIYDRNHLDDHFFPDHPGVWELPVRQKLRINDLRWWLSRRRVPSIKPDPINL